MFFRRKIIKLRRPLWLSPRLISVLAFLVATLGGFIFLAIPAEAQWKTSDTDVTRHLRGVWIAPDMTVFAVGDSGTILRNNGLLWSKMNSGTNRILFDVWGSANNNVAAGGVDTVLVFNGKTWQDITPALGNLIYTPVYITPNGKSLFVGQPNYSGGFDMLHRYDLETGQWNQFSLIVSSVILAFSGTDNDVAVVFETGDIQHTDNSLALTNIHTQVSSLHLQAAWIDSSNGNEAFGVDGAGRMFHFTGGKWTNMNAGIQDSIWGIHGTSGNNVFAVGINNTNKGVMWHYDGSIWARVNIPNIQGLIDVNVASGATGGPAEVLQGKNYRAAAIGEYGSCLFQKLPKNYSGSWTGLVDWTNNKRNYISDVRLFNLINGLPKEVKRLLIFTQCFGGEFAKSPLFQFSNTATISASGPEEPAIYGGFVEGVANGLKPGKNSTGQTVYDDGMKTSFQDGSDFETTEMSGGGLKLKDFSLEPTTATGDVQSRHIIIYCGRPGEGSKRDRKTGEKTGGEVSDADNRDAIKKNFQNQPNTTVHSVGGPPVSDDSTWGQGGWDYRGDFFGLAEAVNKVKEELKRAKNEGRSLEKEQFILFVGDHGEYKKSTNTCTIPSGQSCTTPFNTIDAPVGMQTAMAADPENQPAFEFFLPYDGKNTKVRRDSAQEYIPFYSPGDFVIEIAPTGGTGSPEILNNFFERYCDDGDDILGNQPGEGVLIQFHMNESVFLNRFMNGDSVNIIITNNTSSTVEVGTIAQATGALRRGPYEIKYTLTVAAGSGGTTNPSPGTYAYGGAVDVTISAQPDINFRFGRWAGDVPAGKEMDNPLTITMNSDKSVAAVFHREVYAPLNFSGQKIFNRTLFRAEYINTLSWQANPDNANITGYRIFRIDGGNWSLVGEVSAGASEYSHRNVIDGIEYQYALVAVSNEGLESDAVFVSVR